MRGLGDAAEEMAGQPTRRRMADRAAAGRGRFAVVARAHVASRLITREWSLTSGACRRTLIETLAKLIHRCETARAVRFPGAHEDGCKSVRQFGMAFYDGRDERAIIGIDHIVSGSSINMTNKL